MSLEDLRRLGLIDEGEPAGAARDRAVRLSAALPAAAVGLAGCAAIGLGDGGWLTWAGIVAFLAGLFTFIAANLRAVGGRR